MSKQSVKSVFDLKFGNKSRSRYLFVLVTTIWSTHSFVITTAEALRLFDDPIVPESLAIARGGRNFMINCPGVAEHSFIYNLEWYNLGTTHSTTYKSRGRKLFEYNGDQKTYVLHTQDRIYVENVSWTLNFEPVVHRDRGLYRCLVNHRNLPEADIQLIVEDVPEKPGRPHIGNFTSRSANISWANPYSWSEITSYTVYMRTGVDGPWNHKISTGSNQIWHKVTGLEPNTKYGFQVAATNRIGEGEKSPTSYDLKTLDELPEGKPVITAVNASSTMLRIEFEPPPKRKIHGILRGFRLCYRPCDTDVCSQNTVEIYIKDAKATSYTIKDLWPSTQYLFSLQVYNTEGLGPPSTVSMMTAEGVPTKPRNVSLLLVTDSTIVLSWSWPVEHHGVLKGYEISLMLENSTTVVTTVRESHPLMSFTLSNLDSFTFYKVWVQAFTNKHKGQPSDSLEARTDVRGPSPPKIFNVSCPAEDTIWIEWSPPAVFYNTIDYYFVNLRPKDSEDYKEFVVEAGHELNQAILLENLTEYLTYEVRIQGGTRSVVDTKKVYKGESSYLEILMQLYCEEREKKLVPNLLPAFNNKNILTLTIIAVILVCVAMALTVILIILITWRYGFNGQCGHAECSGRVNATRQGCEVRG